MTAPFTPGQHVLYRPRPHSVLTALYCEPYPNGGGYRLQYRFGSISTIEGGAPAANYVAAPEGWEDAPVRPVRDALYSLDEWALQHRDEQNDAEYQRVMAGYWQARAVWAERHLSRVEGVSPETVTREVMGAATLAGHCLLRAQEIERAAQPALAAE